MSERFDSTDHPAPEDHQRQALEIATRAVQEMPAPPEVPPMPRQVSRLFRRAKLTASDK